MRAYFLVHRQLSSCYVFTCLHVVEGIRGISLVSFIRVLMLLIRAPP